MAEIEWTAPKENNDPLIKYVVYVSTNFDPPGEFKTIDIPASNLMAQIEMSPWTSYTFYVAAKNSIGLSDRNEPTVGECRTQSAIPYRHPNKVCVESRSPTSLVIVWEVCYCWLYLF